MIKIIKEKTTLTIRIKTIKTIDLDLYNSWIGNPDNNRNIIKICYLNNTYAFAIGLDLLGFGIALWVYKHD